MDDAILLSTSKMRGVRIDPGARRARVRAGALWADVAVPASYLGLAPLAGSSPDVGVVGYTLGGGVSWLGRRYGRASENVTAIELVTAGARHIRVDAGHEPDLFWALRGGGGSFGVVTAMEFALHPVREVYAGALAWPWEHGEEVFNAWRQWTEAVPDEVTSACRLLQVPRGRRLVVVEAAILGGGGPELLAPLREQRPELDVFAPMPPAGLLRIHSDPEHPVPGMGDHRMLAELPPSAVAALIDAAGYESGSPLRSVELRHLGGALGRRGPGHGALGGLDGAYAMLGVGMTPDAEATMAIDAGLAALMDALAPWDAGRAYLNFSERSQPAGRFFDAPTLDRLRAIRSRVDPDQMLLADHPV